MHFGTPFLWKIEGLLMIRRMIVRRIRRWWEEWKGLDELYCAKWVEKNRVNLVLSKSWHISRGIYLVELTSVPIEGKERLKEGIYILFIWTSTLATGQSSIKIILLVWINIKPPILLHLLTTGSYKLYHERDAQKSIQKNPIRFFCPIFRLVEKQNSASEW